ncbi:MAG: flagellar biosynthesis anti-sigma factor FlgM [Lachnospirales bacterium]
MDFKISSVTNTYNVKPANQKKGSTKKQELASSGALEVSDTFKEYQKIQKMVSGAEDVRVDKVNEIKSRIQNGTYKVDLDALANKMLGI